MKYAPSDIIEISNRGVVTIPKKYREKLGLRAGGKAIISFNAGSILISPGEIFPIEIYSEERIKEFAREEEEISKLKSLDKKKKLLTAAKAIEQGKTKK